MGLDERIGASAAYPSKSNTLYTLRGKLTDTLLQPPLYFLFCGSKFALIYLGIKPLMATLSNATQHQQPVEMTSSSPADSVLSAVASILGKVSGWELIVTTLLAIVIYDQGIVF